MKMKNVMMLGIGALMSVNIMAAQAPNEVSIETDYEKLEAEFKMLEAREDERFKEEEKIAKLAEQNLASLKAMKAKSTEREKQLLAMTNKSIYTEEVKRLLKEYQSFISAVDKQEKTEERRVFEFNQLKSLR